MKRNITKQLWVCVAMYEILTALRALELALPGGNSETCAFETISI